MKTKECDRFYMLTFSFLVNLNGMNECAKDGVFLNLGLSIRLTFVNIVKQYESETIESVEQSIRQKQYKHSGEE